MSSKIQIILAFLIAPTWVPATIIAAIMLFDPFIKEDGGPVPAGVIGALVTYMGMVVIGLPAFLFLRGRGWTSRWLALALGFGAGIVMFAAFAVAFGWAFGNSLRDQLSMLLQQPLSTDVIPCVVTGGLGALVGITLWLIARPDRP